MNQDNSKDQLTGHEVNIVTQVKKNEQILDEECPLGYFETDLVVGYRGQAPEQRVDVIIGMEEASTSSGKPYLKPFAEMGVVDIDLAKRAGDLTPYPLPETLRDLFFTEGKPDMGKARIGVKAIVEEYGMWSRGASLIHTPTVDGFLEKISPVIAPLLTPSKPS